MTTTTTMTTTMTMTTNSSFVRPLHRLRPDEPGRAARAADTAAHDRRAVFAVHAVRTV